MHTLQLNDMNPLTVEQAQRLVDGRAFGALSQLVFVRTKVSAHAVTFLTGKDESLPFRHLHVGIYLQTTSRS
jgi:hypothetical protein